MTRLGFWWDKAWGGEPALERWGAPVGTLLAELRGRDVALVGNARSLAEGAAGAAIDAADVVIRMNAAPMPLARSHGTRTDWLGVSVAVPAAVIAERAPRRVIWVTPKRRRLPYRIARAEGFALYPAARHADLSARLGARPTTGLMLVDLVAASEAARYTLYGFDFFASQSLSGRRTAADVPHDFGAEATFVAALAARDARLCRG
jgi:hypothetical protein